MESETLSQIVSLLTEIKNVLGSIAILTAFIAFMMFIEWLKRS